MLAADLQQIKERAIERIQAEREQAVRRIAELDADLRALRGEQGLRLNESGQVELVELEPPEPTSDWSIKRIIVHYLERNPGAASGDIVAYVSKIRPRDDHETLPENVHSDLYKLAKAGTIEALGKRGSYRYSLKGENPEA